jgi:hypothetical protein
MRSVRSPMDHRCDFMSRYSGKNSSRGHLHPVFARAFSAKSHFQSMHVLLRNTSTLFPRSPAVSVSAWVFSILHGCFVPSFAPSTASSETSEPAGILSNFQALLTGPTCTLRERSLPPWNFSAMAQSISKCGRSWKVPGSRSMPSRSKSPPQRMGVFRPWASVRMTPAR